MKGNFKILHKQKLHVLIISVPHIYHKNVCSQPRTNSIAYYGESAQYFYCALMAALFQHLKLFNLGIADIIQYISLFYAAVIKLFLFC